MAGSFGYTAKHLRTSRSMGELGLFPALRATPVDHPIIANGFSCRAQIRDGTGRRARHLVEVLAGRLDRNSQTARTWNRATDSPQPQNRSMSEKPAR
ncbi:MAG: hypothetical protein F4Y24_01730 [Gemmatimonadetes bacterium]|nr:hypothetical protein [Gemmatimonadota bacterium]MYG24153.1 hypothetical protein [Gemmatimonadota bacterium]